MNFDNTVSDQNNIFLAFRLSVSPPLLKVWFAVSLTLSVFAILIYGALNLFDAGFAFAAVSWVFFILFASWLTGAGSHLSAGYYENGVPNAADSPGFGKQRPVFFSSRVVVPVTFVSGVVLILSVMVFLTGLSSYAADIAPALFGILFFLFFILSLPACGFIFVSFWLCAFYPHALACSFQNRTDVIKHLLKKIFHLFPLIFMKRLRGHLFTLFYTAFFALVVFFSVYLFLWTAVYFDLLSGGFPYASYIISALPGGAELINLYNLLPFAYLPVAGRVISEYSTPFKLGIFFVGLSGFSVLNLFLTFILSYQCSHNYVIYKSVIEKSALSKNTAYEV